MTSKTALLVEDVSVAYDSAPVIHDISFKIKPGEFFGLMGLNGAGKTTLIKSILGLRDAQTGTIEVLGHARGDTAWKSNVVYLPERFEPPWFLTGLEFVKFSMDLYGAPFNKDDVLERAKTLALNPDDLKKRVGTYSKGMRQKLGLLATVYTGSKFLVLDEPMSGLDPLARSLVKDVLLDCKKRKQTVLFCSHVLADMEELCDRVALMHEGALQFVGKAETLKKRASSKTLERAFMHFIKA